MSFASFGQKLKTFKGSFDVGLAQSGSATYTYFEDSLTRDFIKQGSFKFIFKGKGDYSGYNQTITGNYVKGLKSGIWTCVITMLDFGTGNPYETGTLTIIANYKKGYADGNWKEVYSSKNRERNFVHGQLQWQPYKAIKIKAINMNFKNGVLVGVVDINDGFTKYKVKGGFDNNSFCIGTWIINDGFSVRSRIYKDNFLYESLDRSNNGKVLEDRKYQTEYNNYIKAKSMSINERYEAGLIIDTICGNEVKESTSYIIEYLTELLKKQYFFYEYIDGDLSYKEGLVGGCELQIKYRQSKK